MFLDRQNFAGSWGRDFVGNCFVPLQCTTSLNVRGGRKFVGKGSQENPRT